MPRRSPAQEQLAVTLYVCGSPDVRGNMTESYLQAGYCPGGKRTTASKDAQGFFARPRVSAAVAQMAAKMQSRIMATAEDVLEEMDAIIFADPADAYGPDGKMLPVPQMPRRFRRAIASIEEGKIRLVPKTPVIQLRGETLGLWERMVEKQVNALPEQARIERAAALLEKALARLPARAQTVEAQG